MTKVLYTKRLYGYKFTSKKSLAVTNFAEFIFPDFSRQNE